MFENYFTIAIRNLMKNKIFTAVNILKLAIEMAACFFAFRCVNFESSYDRFNKYAPHLYPGRDVALTKCKLAFWKNKIFLSG